MTLSPGYDPRNVVSREFELNFILASGVIKG